MIAQLRCLWVVCYLDLKQLIVNPLTLFSMLVNPLILTLISIYILGSQERFDPLFVVVGSWLLGLWTGVIYYSVGSVTYERTMGTLEMIIASPVGLAFNIVGKLSAHLILGSTCMLASYIFALSVVDIEMNVTRPAAFIISVFVTIFSMLSIGLTISPFMSLVVGSSIWADAIKYPTAILGGFLFSISLLPSYVQRISFIFSPYWAAKVLHDTSTGDASLREIAISWFCAILLNLIYLIIARYLFSLLISRAKQAATLGLY